MTTNRHEMKRQADIDRITAAIAAKFPCFGGGKGSSWGNPLSAALKDKPAAFALGVDVREVVMAVLNEYTATT